MSGDGFITDMQRLKREKNALIFAHPFQPTDMQKIADYTGDTFEMIRHAENNEHEIIVVCGIYHMAEALKMMFPDKKILLPNPMARCNHTDLAIKGQIKELQKAHPNAVLISFITSDIQLKALSTYCVSATHAVEVVSTIEAGEIIFYPDENLGAFLKQATGKDIYTIPYYCNAHKKVNVERAKEQKENHPEAQLLVHPECSPELTEIAAEVNGTTGMIHYIDQSKEAEFLIAAEQGFVKSLVRMFPDKKVLSASSSGICPDMRKISQDHLYMALLYEQHEIELENNEITENARESIAATLDIIKT